MRFAVLHAKNAHPADSASSDAARPPRASTFRVPFLQLAAKVVGASADPRWRPLQSREVLQSAPLVVFDRTQDTRRYTRNDHPGRNILSLTTVPAPTIERSPIVTPGRMVASAPMNTREPTVILPNRPASGCSRRNTQVPASWVRNFTPPDTSVSSPILTRYGSDPRVLTSKRQPRPISAPLRRNNSGRLYSSARRMRSSSRSHLRFHSHLSQHPRGPARPSPSRRDGTILQYLCGWGSSRSRRVQA